MKQIGLFAGIGGFELAARWVGWETIAVSEIDPFCQKVLQYHFPGAQLHGDIKTTDFTEYRGQCDIITGGFPCQPFSAAGKRRGTADERYLWPEMLRVIDEVKPRWVIGENVRGLVNWDGGMVFETVCTELESAGYEVQPFIIPAAGVNAPHRRDRIWFVANSYSARLQETRTEQQTTRFEQYRELGGLIANASDCRCGGRACEQCANRWSELFPREYKGSEMGSEVTRCSGEWLATNTHGIRLEHTEDARNIQGGPTKAQGEGSQSSEPTQTDGYTRNAPDTDSCGSGTDSPKNVFNPASVGRNALNNEYGNVEQGQGKREFSATNSARNAWDGFPTQSPVCGGNDGVPNRLDGITFSKWRKESIKGYGNAIVPQVAYEIYKAIILYEQIWTNNE